MDFKIIYIIWSLPLQNDGLQKFLYHLKFAPCSDNGLENYSYYLKFALVEKTLLRRLYHLKYATFYISLLLSIRKRKNSILEIHTRNMYTEFGANQINRNREIVYQKMSSSHIIVDNSGRILGNFRQISKSYKIQKKIAISKCDFSQHRDL